MVVRTCSQLRPGLNIAYDVMNGILPIAAMPLATDAMFCSATPSSTKRSGYFFLKGAACAHEAIAEASANGHLFDVIVEHARVQTQCGFEHRIDSMRVVTLLRCG